MSRAVGEVAVRVAQGRYGEIWGEMSRAVGEVAVRVASGDVLAPHVDEGEGAAGAAGGAVAGDQDVALGERKGQRSRAPTTRHWKAVVAVVTWRYGRHRLPLRAPTR